MITYTPEMLLQASEGTVPEAITGVLTNLQASPITGGEGDKAYKFQNATLTLDGHSIRIVFSGRKEDVSQELSGQRIIAKCRKSDKGLFGLKRKIGREYQGQRPPEIWVYAGADLSAFEEAETNNTEPEQTTMSQTPESKPDATSYAPATKKKFVQMANAMNLCYNTAMYVAKLQSDKGNELTEAQVQAIASSFFIKADRNGLVDTMPQSPIKES